MRGSVLNYRQPIQQSSAARCTFALLGNMRFLLDVVKQS